MAQDAKANKKQGAFNRTESLLPVPCRIKKLIELKEDVPTVATSVTEEHHRQDVKQKQPLKIHPLRHRKADEKTIDCKQTTSNIIPIHIRRSDYQQDIRKSRIPKPTWQKILRRNCQPKKLSTKLVGLFSKVTSYRTEKN